MGLRDSERLFVCIGGKEYEEKVLIGFMMTSIVLSAIGCGKNEVIDALGNTQRVETQAESDKEDDEELVVNQEKNKAKEQGEEKKEVENKEEVSIEDTSKVENEEEQLDEKVNIDKSKYEKYMQFTFDKNKYELPMTYSEFEKNGWTIDWEIQSEDERVVSPGEYEVAILINDKFEDGVYIFAYFTNVSNDDKKLEDCPIIGFEMDLQINDEMPENIPEIEIANGIKFGKTSNDIINALGEPDYTYIEKGEYTSYEYSDEDCDYEIGFTLYDGIGIGKIMLMNNTIYNEYSDMIDEEIDELEYEETDDELNELENEEFN